MNEEAKIRPIYSSDLSSLKRVIAANELFSPQMLDEMTASYFEGKSDTELWLTYEETEPVAVAYCSPEKMTEGTWNLYLIAVHPDYQGKGCGKKIVRYLENLLKNKSARILLVETSSLPEFTATQQFYLKCGFEKEARVRDFYQAGEDKIVFRKAL